jgi:hypothetical protein
MNDEILLVTRDQIQRKKFNGCNPVVFQNTAICIYVYNTTVQYRSWWGKLREGKHWGDPDVDGRII